MIQFPLTLADLPFDFHLLPSPVYLVGGAVRDALLGRKRTDWDLDFVLPGDAIQGAKSLANHYQAGFVVLDEGRNIARVVFPQGTVDLAQQEGESLETDLRRRDFTINAIAYDFQTQSLIDPLLGKQDLDQQLIRMVSRQNLQDDPLRILRAYRQSAQLGFTLESETEKALKELSSLLGTVAAERVQAELNYILNLPQGTQTLIKAWQDGVLKSWFPTVHLEAISKLEMLESAFDQLEKELQQQLLQPLSQTIKNSGLSMVKLALIFSEAPEESLLKLKYSRVEIRAVTTALKYLPQLQTLPLTIAQQFFLFRDVKEVFPVLALLALVSGVELDAISRLSDRYLNSQDPVAHPIPLITGNDLMKALNLSPSPQIGELLTALGVAQAEGKISTPEAALNLAQKLLTEASFGQ